MKIWLVIHQVFHGDLHIDAFRKIKNAEVCRDETLDNYEREGDGLTRDANAQNVWMGEDGETYVEVRLVDLK